MNPIKTVLGCFCIGSFTRNLPHAGFQDFSASSVVKADMPTTKRLTANRQNALKSTGPKTATGKMIASRNSTKHGFYSTAVLLPNEDEEEFLRLARRFVSAHRPCGLQEEELVRTIIETSWRLRRTSLVENHLFQMYGNYKGEDRGVGTAFAQDAVHGNAFSKLAGFETHLLKRLYRAEEALGRLKSQAAVPLALVQKASVFQDQITAQNTIQALPECSRRSAPLAASPVFSAVAEPIGVPSTAR